MAMFKKPEGIQWLVGGLEHFGTFFNFPFHIWDVILPIDELIFFRGVGQPPTSSGNGMLMG